MLTPSGRFAPNTAICASCLALSSLAGPADADALSLPLAGTSMSNFHPGSWNVSWSIETILVGLLSFMLSEEITTGKSSSPSLRRSSFPRSPSLEELALERPAG